MNATPKKLIARSILVVGMLLLVITAADARGIQPGITFATNGIDLKIDSHAFYNGNLFPTSTWYLKDLNPSADHFFNFDDVKPGDWGKTVISMHVKKHDAWMCLDFKNLKSDDNGQNEPEALADADGDSSGELASNLFFFAWQDDGDNVFEVGETPLFGNNPLPATTALNETSYAIADAGHGNSCRQDTTRYVGIAWCAGTMTVNLANAQISCDGSHMGNASQTDSMSVDISIRAVPTDQAPNFVCKQPPVEEPSCPFTPQDGRTIVKFAPPAQWVISDGTAAQAQLAPVATNLAAGTYKVSLFSYDGYANRGTVTQPNETWFGILKHGSTDVVHTGASTDLQDYITNTSRSDVVNAALNIPQSIDSIIAKSNAYPNKKSANSVAPICAAFDKIPEPTPPSCPFQPQDGRIIVNFAPPTKWVWSDSTAAEAQLPPVATNIPAGKYKVSLFSYDGYASRVNVSQPNETWFGILKHGNTDVAHTGASTDLADYVASTSRTDVVNTSLNISQSIDSIIAKSNAYPNKKSANSVAPICAALDPIPEPGSVRVCKVTVDKYGKPMNDSFGGSTFSIPGIAFAGHGEGSKSVGVFATSTFSMPLTLNTDLFDKDGVNDAQCVTYNNLKLGSYYYGKETITGSGWDTPKYNDSFNAGSTAITKVSAYSGELFTSSTSDDANRNQTADGNIVLTESKPSKTLLIVNKRK
jgi:hypothetical protein